MIFVKPALKIYNQILEDRVTWSLARGFLKRRNAAEMASDALWVVSFKCVVKGYQECRFDVKDGEVFNVLKKVGEKGRAFRTVNERGQLGHLQHLIIYFDFDLRKKIILLLHLLFILFYHDSKMFSNVQYTDARSPLTLMVTVNCP